MRADYANNYATKSPDFQLLTNQLEPTIVRSAAMHQHVIYHVGYRRRIPPINSLGLGSARNNVIICNVSNDWPAPLVA